jgi:hypothetical protein
MSLSNLTSSQLRKAAAIIEKIEKLQSQLNELSGAEIVSPAAKPAGKRRKISAAGIAKIRAAQKARWAKVHAAKGKGK